MQLKPKVYSAIFLMHCSNGGTSAKYFATTLTGGAWTHRHLGVDYDALKGHASNASATAWCRRFRMQIEFGANIKKFGEDVAMQLADT